MGISIGGVDVELRTKAFINGEFVDALDGSVFDSYVPSNGTVLAQVAACSDVDVDRAVRSARAAFDAGTWSRIAPAERKTIMLRFADLVERDLEPLAHLEALDAGPRGCGVLDDVLGEDLERHAGDGDFRFPIDQFAGCADHVIFRYGDVHIKASEFAVIFTLVHVFQILPSVAIVNRRLRIPLRSIVGLSAMA